MTTPTHEYETVEGTKPTAHGVHEPRTIKHVAGDDLFMMSEIGDGTFVQWSNCRRCNLQVAGCTCPEGPKEPEYITRWREDRFSKELNARPEPSYTLIPSLIEWLTERGYDVTKSFKKQLEEAKPFNSATDVGIVDLTDEEAADFNEALGHGSAGITAKSAEEAIEKAKQADEFPDF